MTLEQILTEVSRELSGAVAKQNVARIAAHHRIQGSPGFDDAVNEIKEALERWHIPCTVHTYPADGKTKTYSWAAPLGWSVRSGSLRQLSPKEKSLVRFDEISQGVIAHSRGGAAEAEVVDVGEGTCLEDYAGRDVADKYVMATGKPQEVAPLAVDHGAIGIILYPTPQRAGEWPDLVQYAGFWPQASQIEQTPLGFSISRRQADSLLAALREGPVRLAGSIDADLGPGNLRVLEARIPGHRPQAREILLISHLCHPTPSANDNASGSALLLEIARTLAQLTKEGKLTLDRSIRFLWVPEFYGTLPWAASHRQQIENILFVLNLDMVGQSPERLGEPFRVSRAPGSTPSVLNAWFEPLLERIEDDPNTIAPRGTRRPMQWQLDPPSGGSDHVVFSDPLFGVPAVMFGHGDPLHHTHLDDVDMVDPTELKRVGVLAATLALLPGTLPQETDRLAGWLLRYSLTAIQRSFELSLGMKEASIEEFLGPALTLEEQRLASFKRLLDEASVAWDESGLRHVLTATRDALLETGGGSEAKQDHGSEGPLPRKAFEGPLPYAFFRSLSKEDRRFMEREFTGPYGAITLEGLNLCDGKRTLREIALRLSLEFGHWISIETVTRALGILEEGGWVELYSPSG